MIIKRLVLLLLLQGLIIPQSHADNSPPAMLLANVYVANIDISEYWVSEKLDGVRAQWDGHQLHFRSGRVVHAPAWFTANFPPVPLDGELWIARNQFDTLSGMVRKFTPIDDEWRQVHYMVFELPEAAESFTERIQKIHELILIADTPWLQMIEQTRGVDHKTLIKRLEEVCRMGGEGLMLHRADAPYLSGRSDVLLKLKPWLDTEAVLVGYLPGKGKYIGMTGALTMQMPNGKQFNIGSGLSDTLRRHPPALGTTITYRYQQQTKNGIPRFPTYVRIREDF